MSHQQAADDKASGTDNQPALTKDDIYGVLANQRRRDILDTVLGGGEVSKSRLVDLMAELEFGEGYTSDERKRVLVSCHQCHLPKLADLGVIEYENERVVRPGPNAALVQRHRHDSRAGVIERLTNAL